MAKVVEAPSPSAANKRRGKNGWELQHIKNLIYHRIFLHIIEFLLRYTSTIKCKYIILTLE